MQSYLILILKLVFSMINVIIKMYLIFFYIVFIIYIIFDVYHNLNKIN